MDALAGTHVRLEPLSLSHVAALTAAVSGDESRSTYGWTWVPDGESAMETYVVEALAGVEDGTMLPFAIVWNDRIVGSTRLILEAWAWPESSPMRRDDGRPDVCEIGYTWLSRVAQGTIVNTEAKLLLLSHAFDVWDVHRVSLRTDSRNERSRAAILRLGAQFEGIRRAHEPAADGTVRDTAWFSILRNEWPTVKARLRALVDER